MSGNQYLTSRAALAAVALAGVLAWLLVSLLPPVVLKAGLILTTVSLPVAFWAGWKLGGRKAETYLAGVDRGTGTIIDTVAKVSRAASGRTWSEPRLPPALPMGAPGQVEVIHLSSANQGEVIDL
jgi:hypothetical protein